VRCSAGMEAWLMVQGISPRPQKSRFVTLIGVITCHNMSPDVTRNEELCTESGTVHTSLDGRTVRMRLFSSLQGHSLYLNRSQWVVPRCAQCPKETVVLKSRLASSKRREKSTEPARNQKLLQLSLTHAKHPRKEYIKTRLVKN
jgi:hypothetical protein